MSDQNNNYYGQQQPYYQQPMYYPPNTVPQGQVPYAPAQPAAPQYAQQPAVPYMPQQPYYPTVPVADVPPQGQMPYVPVQSAAPQYAPYPYMPPQQPYYQPAAPAAPQAITAAEPEVILQNPTFENYGFTPDDMSDSGHNFGNFMDDTSNTEETLSDNIFTSTTPNLSIEDVEAASKEQISDGENIFTATTPNFAISDVEIAANTTSQTDIDIFSNSSPVMEYDSEPVAPVAPQAVTATEPETPALNFMAQMQSMFSSMATAPAAPVAAEPAMPVAPAAPVAAEPAMPVAPAAPIAAEPEVPAQIAFQKPDMVINGASTNTIQDISSTVPDAEEKGPEYWAYMDSLLNNFDDGQLHTRAEVGAQPYQVQEEVKEEKPHFPFSVGAATADSGYAQPAPQSAQQATPAYDPAVIAAALSSASVAGAVTASQEVPQVPQTQMNYAPAQSVPQPAQTPAPVAYVPPVQSEVTQEDDKSWLIPEEEVAETTKEDAKAAKKAEKEAAKAAKAEAKAAKKAEKKAAKSSKVQAKSGDVAVLAEDTTEEEKEARKGVKGKLASVFPVKGDSAPEIIRKMVLIISAIALIVCGIYLLNVFIDGRTNAKVYNDLSNTLADAERNEADWSTIAERYPNIQFPNGMQTKFADLYAMNQDLIGWIRIKGLGIDFPVVQTSDDAYYLKHDYVGNSSVYGTIFLSKGNNAKELDLNNVIYGHSMRRDTQMFTALKEYKEIDGFKKNPIIEYSTLYDNYKFKIYAVFITNGSSAGDVGGYVFDYTFSNLASTSSFAGFINQVNQRKLYTTGVSVKQDDKLLTLSTCTYEFDNARLVVIGRLLRDGESEEIDFSKVEENSNPRYPQAWYDAKGQSNPYASYDQWSPTVSA